MEILKSVENGKAVLTPVGRLDTTTSPELEQVLTELLPGLTELTMDFAQLEYISSAGLRVLLMAVTETGRVMVLNASEAVKEIFETTGFNQMIEVR